MYGAKYEHLHVFFYKYSLHLSTNIHIYLLCYKFSHFGSANIWMPTGHNNMFKK